MSNKYCNKYKKLIMERLDGEISDNDNVHLDIHIKTCESCRIYFVKIEKIKKVINTLTYEIPPFIEEKIMSKITQKTYKQPVFYFNLRPVWGYALSFGMVLFVSIFLIYNKFENKTIQLSDIPVISEIPVSKEVKNVEMQKITNKSINAVSEVAKQHDSAIKIQEPFINEQKTALNTSIIIEEKTNIKPIQDYNVKKIDLIKPGLEAAKVTPIPPVPYNPLLEKDKAIVANNVINPLRGDSAIIRFIVDDTAFVKIVIYDKNIRPVSIILNEEKTRGTYEAIWSGKSDNNQIVSEGVYFVYIQIGTRVVKKSIIVNK